jgi:hypothetical protein
MGRSWRASRVSDDPEVVRGQLDEVAAGRSLAVGGRDFGWRVEVPGV